MKARRKNEKSNAFHSDRGTVDLLQRLDHPTFAGQPAYAVPAIHTSTERFHRDAGSDRRIHSISDSRRQHAHAERNAVRDDHKHGHTRIAYTDSHTYAACIHHTSHRADRAGMQYQH